MNWTCDECKRTQITPGTVYWERRVCLSCYHKLRANAKSKPPGVSLPKAKITLNADGTGSLVINGVDLYATFPCAGLTIRSEVAHTTRLTIEMIVGEVEIEAPAEVAIKLKGEAS